MIRAELIGADALAAKMQADLAKVEAAKPYWLMRTGEILEESIKANIMQQGLYRTGDLYDSGRVFYPTKNGISVGFGWGLGYAESLELGAVAHEIVGNPLLAFYWEKADMDFVGPKVNHPGNPAYRFIYHGTYQAFEPILLMFQSMLRGIFGF